MPSPPDWNDSHAYKCKHKHFTSIYTSCAFPGGILFIYICFNDSKFFIPFLPSSIPSRYSQWWLMLTEITVLTIFLAKFVLVSYQAHGTITEGISVIPILIFEMASSSIHRKDGTHTKGTNKNMTQNCKNQFRYTPVFSLWAGRLEQTDQDVIIDLQLLSIL